MAGRLASSPATLPAKAPVSAPVLAAPPPPPTTTATNATAAFSAFLLGRIASNPHLIHETAHTLSTKSSDGNVPVSLDAAQRALVASASSATATAALNGPAMTGLLQRALVDAPLLPHGGAHLLHELVTSPFVACAEVAKQVGCFRRALELQEEARTCDGTTQQGEEVVAVTSQVGGESVLGASPLATSSSPTADAAAAPVRAGGSGSETMFTAAELSATLTPEVLRGRLAQAQSRLAELKAVLQRGLVKLRRVAQELQDYDAVPLDERRRRRRATVRELLTPVTVSVGSLSAPVAADVASPSTSAAAGVEVVVAVEQDRKRPRTAEQPNH